MKEYWDYKHFGEKEVDGQLTGTVRVKYGFADMLKGGVVMDVTNAEQARIAEKAGAISVMVLDKLPYDVRKVGGIARTASVEKIKDIVSKSNFNRDDFINLANILKSFEPDILISIFEALSGRFEEAEEAYIYILLQLEMIDKAKEILDLSSEKEFLKLKAYLSLKEAGEHFQIELFI